MSSTGCCRKPALHSDNAAWSVSNSPVEWWPESKAWSGDCSSRYRPTEAEYPDRSGSARPKGSCHQVHPSPGCCGHSSAELETYGLATALVGPLQGEKRQMEGARGGGSPSSSCEPCGDAARSMVEGPVGPDLRSGVSPPHLPGRWRWWDASGWRDGTAGLRCYGRTMDTVDG